MILQRLAQARGTQKRAWKAGRHYLIAGSAVAYTAPEPKCQSALVSDRKCLDRRHSYNEGSPSE